MQHVRTSLVKLEALVADVMQLTKLKFSEIASEPIDVKALFEQAIEKIKDLDGADSITFEVDVSLERPIVTKRLFIQQIIENLVSNAIKYMDYDQPSPTIWFSVAEDNGHYLLVVKDNGIGVPEASREKLFGMFQRMHTNVSFGSGLGLYMVKQNVERLGGSIRYEPTQDGSLFKIKLPIMKVS